MKKALLLLSFFFVLFSCQKGEQGTFFSAESSNKHLLERFPMLGKELIKIKEVTMDTLSISIYKTLDDYNKVVVFRKDNQFQSVPLFYNVYFDYWEYQETQPQTASKTGTTFDKEIKSVFRNLKLSRDEENNIREELMKSVLNTETFLDEKPQLFNIVFKDDLSLDNDGKMKLENEDSCLARNQKIYQYILNESRKTIRNKAFYLDREHNRVYEWVYNSGKIQYPLMYIKVHRIGCFTSYILENVEM